MIEMVLILLLNLMLMLLLLLLMRFRQIYRYVKMCISFYKIQGRKRTNDDDEQADDDGRLTEI